MGCSSSSNATKKEHADKEATKKATCVDSLPDQPHRGEDIRDKYLLGKVLGSGSFGQVREATFKDHPGEEVRAVKMIESDQDHEAEDGEWSNKAIFVREVALLQQIKHEHVIRYYDFYEDVHFLYVVMELCKGGEVFTKILELRRFSEKNAVALGKQMLRAMEYIHDLKIAHRDIKAENFMLADNNSLGTNNDVKMIDFGFATRFEEGQVLTELCGSPHYLAPELIGQKYNYKADVWAFGVLLYLLMYGHYPYDAKHPRDIMVKILTEQIRWQTKAKLSSAGVDFLKRCLEHVPRKRVSATEALAHAWMKLADSNQDSEILPAEVIRSAHKKITGTRKQIDPKIDEVRNQKLNKINEDFDKGIRWGKRLGETPKEEFMSKPEFVRRENKITTAPSTNMDARRGSLRNMLNMIGSKESKESKRSSTVATSVLPVLAESEPDGKGEGDAQAKEKNNADTAQQAGAGTKTLSLPKAKGGPPAGKTRAASCAVLPGRLSYIGALSNEEETKLKTLFETTLRSTGDKGVTEVSDPEKAGVIPGQIDRKDADDAPLSDVVSEEEDDGPASEEEEKNE